LLAAEGAHVVVNDLGGRNDGTGQDQAVAHEVVAEITHAGGAAVANTDDVSTTDGADAAVAAAVDAFGGVDILVNNAGVFRTGDVYALTDDDWDAVIRVNLRSAFVMTRSAAGPMIRGGGGAIVNTSSTSGLGHAGMANYAAAKEGVIGLTRSVARELGRFRIRCNAIRPIAMTQTARDAMAAFDRWSPLNRAVAARAGASTTRGVEGDLGPEHAAALAVWLCTDAAQGVNGRTAFVAGGQIGLYPEPQPVMTAWREGGWGLDDLDGAGASTVFGGLTDAFAVDLRLLGDEDQRAATAAPKEAARS
jgi:NAD(P)-dependent dehydrogenase (short-subunit alcohol dehydrogenase family)